MVAGRGFSVVVTPAGRPRLFSVIRERSRKPDGFIDFFCGQPFHKSPLLVKWQGSTILILPDPKIRMKSGVNAWKIK
jgi:hypothetical protein